MAIVPGQTVGEFKDYSKTNGSKPKAELQALADKAELERLRAENAALKQAKSARTRFSLKVSEKGALSYYGGRRFPTTLYRDEWLELLTDEHVKAIKDFIKANGARLSSKTDD